MKFYEARTKVLSEHNRKGIGTLSEKTLHAVLKGYFEPFEDSREVEIGPFVADIVGEDGIIEIQTKSFSKLRPKLEEFLKYSRVTVVYPCISEKNIICFDPETGEVFSKRRSPLKGDKYTVFTELEAITDYLLHPNFRLCIVFLKADEYRCPQDKAPLWQKKKRRKNAYASYDKIPTELLDEIYISGIEDWLDFLPPCLPESFTSSDMAKAGMDIMTARLVLNVFYKAGIVKREGKRGREYLYRI